MKIAVFVSGRGSNLKAILDSPDLKNIAEVKAVFSNKADCGAFKIADNYSIKTYCLGGGIAAIVQGLGFGALASVVLSGSSWFLSWIYGASWANSVIAIHIKLTGLIEAYVIGHGAMGILHLILQVKKQKNR